MSDQTLFDLKFEYLMLQKKLASRAQVNQARLLQQRIVAEQNCFFSLADILQQAGLVSSSQRKSLTAECDLLPDDLEGLEPPPVRADSGIRKEVREKIKAKRFGLIAFQKGFVTKDQIDRALKQQEREAAGGKPQILIGDLMVQSGTITAEQRDLVLMIQQAAEPTGHGGKTESLPPLARKTLISERKFGMLAIRNGFATRDQVDRALTLQRKQAEDGLSWMRIGDLLLRMGAISEEQRNTVLWQQRQDGAYPQTEERQTGGNV